MLAFFSSGRVNGLPGKVEPAMSGEIEATARGHLAADAVLKHVNDSPVVELRLGVGIRRKVGDVWTDLRTDWLDVSVWGFAAAGAATLRRGQLVEVRGSLTPSAYLASSGEAVAAIKLNARAVLVVPRAPVDATRAPVLSAA